MSEVTHRLFADPLVQYSPAHSYICNSYSALSVRYSLNTAWPEGDIDNVIQVNVKALGS